MPTEAEIQEAANVAFLKDAVRQLLEAYDARDTHQTEVMFEYLRRAYKPFK